MFSIFNVIPNPFPMISKSIEQKYTYFKKNWAMWNVVIISKWHVNQGIFVNLERDSMKIRPMTIFKEIFYLKRK